MNGTTTNTKAEQSPVDFLAKTEQNPAENPEVSGLEPVHKVRMLETIVDGMPPILVAHPRPDCNRTTRGLRRPVRKERTMDSLILRPTNRLVVPAATMSQPV